jgi:hypothetical protein
MLQTGCTKHVVLTRSSQRETWIEPRQNNNQSKLDRTTTLRTVYELAPIALRCVMKMLHGTQPIGTTLILKNDKCKVQHLCRRLCYMPELHNSTADL